MHPRTHLAKHSEKKAVIFYNGPSMTYGELECASNQTAHLLRFFGLRRGDAVALFLENEIAFFELIWAAQKAGLFVVPVSTKLLADELSYILNDCAAKLLVCSSKLAEVGREASLSAPECSVLVTQSGAADGYEKQRNAQPKTPIEDESPGIDMVYSSGTTGRPKGVRIELPDGPIDQDTRMEFTARARYNFDEESVYLSPAPLYHAGPLRWVMTVQRLGGTVIVLDRFDAQITLEAIEQYAVTHAQFVPTHFSRLLDLPQDIRNPDRLDTLVCVIHAAAPCPVQVKRDMMAWLGPIIYEYYGGSEGIGVTVADPQEWLDHPGTVGRPVNCEVHICDDEGNVLPTGAVGSVYFAGGPRFSYHNDTAKTAAAYNERGWATLGDVGYLDGDGFLYLTDRKGFMIISGGVNVYPQEIEDHLVAHKDVLDAAVVAAPHPDLGEQVVAVVQLRDGISPSHEMGLALLDFLRQRLSSVKVPRRIDFMTEIPRLPTGKLLKRLIKDAYFGRNDEVEAQLIRGIRR